MTKSLASKYRPRCFSEIVGQKLTAVVFQQMVKENSVPSAILLSGPRGTGKTSIARILGMELNSSERDSILAGTSLSVLEIDSASHGSVADIRALSQQLQHNVGAEKTVVILDEAHSITRDGFNALLKTLEEPPEHVIFVLVTTEPNKLPETILDRVMEFDFRRVAPSDLLTRILFVAQAEGIDISHDLAVKLSESADGSVRDAVKNLDFVHRAGITTVQQYIELTGETDPGPILLASLATNNHAKIFQVFNHFMLEIGDSQVLYKALTDVITDLFILKSEGHVTASGKALEHRLKLAKTIPSENLFGAVQILWDLKTKVRSSEDQKTVLAVALVLVADKLSAGRTHLPVKVDSNSVSPVVLTEEAPRELSLSEIQQS